MATAKRKQVGGNAAGQSHGQAKLNGDHHGQHGAQDAGGGVHGPGPFHGIVGAGDPFAATRMAPRPARAGRSEMAFPSRSRAGISIIPLMSEAVAESESHPGHQTARKKNHVGDKRCNYQDQRHPGQFGVRKPAARKQAAGAAREHEEKDHYGQRVGRMSEKKHEALDECDLHQNVTQADGYEIKQRKRRLTASPKRQRQDKEKHDSQK